MIVLSGGTGTPKLLTGLKDVTSDFCVIVNTAEDVWISGNKICPDIDSVIYALAGVIDDVKWWGIKDDSFTTHHKLKELGFDEVLMIGDKDRATHILRSEMLRAGKSLTEATRIVAKAYNVNIEIYPMCEEDVETIVVTDKGEMHFQDFWVKFRGEPEVIDVYFKGIEKARLTDDIIKAIKRYDEVLIGPSNPITSILPILSVENFAELLKNKKVIAISPMVGSSPFSGPAAKLMAAKGFDVSPLGVMDVYKDFLDILIVDAQDADLISEKIVATNIFIRSREDAIKLSEFVLKLFDRI